MSLLQTSLKRNRGQTTLLTSGHWCRLAASYRPCVGHDLAIVTGVRVHAWDYRTLQDVVMWNMWSSRFWCVLSVSSFPNTLFDGLALMVFLRDQHQVVQQLLAISGA